jgi:hypothetical protein
MKRKTKREIAKIIKGDATLKGCYSNGMTDITPKSLKGELLVTSCGQGNIVITPLVHLGDDDEYAGFEASLTQAQVFDLIDCLLKWSAENQDRKRECSRIDS